MRYSVILAPAFAAVALGQTTTYPSGYVNPFTAYLTETDSRGVVTGQPSVNTDVATSEPAQTAVAVTTQPSVITSQEAAATVPAGTPSAGTTLVPVASGSSNGSTGSNNTVSTGSLKSSGAASTQGSSTTASSAAGSSTGTATSGSSSSSSSSSSTNGAGMLEPILGLGFAGALFAAFL